MTFFEDMHQKGFHIPREETHKTSFGYRGGLPFCDVQLGVGVWVGVGEVKVSHADFKGTASLTYGI